MKKTKETLGTILKDRREELRLTQRELAAKLGVKASHVAYLENGRRRPSDNLLKRLASVLSIELRELYVLSRPVVREFLNGTEKQEDAWKVFAASGLPNQLRATDAELKVLRQVAALAPVRDARQFAHVLTSIRQARA